MLRMTSYVVLGFDCISSFARRGLPGGSQMVKNLPAMRETQVQYLGQEIPWRRKWQLTPIFLQRIPRTEEPGALQSMGSQRVGHDWVTNTHTHTHTHTHDERDRRLQAFVLALQSAWKSSGKLVKDASSKFLPPEVDSGNLGWAAICC